MNERIDRALTECAAEYGLGFAAEVLVSGERIVIDTRVSRNPLLSANGGDYHLWLRLWPHAGNILAQERNSTDFGWNPDPELEIVGSEEDWPGLSHEIVTAAQQRGLAMRYE
jgi:hypothetical protein